MLRVPFIMLVSVQWVFCNAAAAIDAVVIVVVAVVVVVIIAAVLSSIRHSDVTERIFGAASNFPIFKVPKHYIQHTLILQQILRSDIRRIDSYLSNNLGLNSICVISIVWKKLFIVTIFLSLIY